MSRHLPKKQRDRLPYRFTPIETVLLKSEAWLVLSHPARVAYLHLKAEVNHKYQETVELTYEAMEPIMQRRTYAKALRALEEVGLIRREQYGGLYRKKNVFSFSQQWKKYEANRTINSKGQVAKRLLSQVAKRLLSKEKESDSSGINATCSGGFA